MNHSLLPFTPHSESPTLVLISPPADRRVLFQNVRWSTYQALLADLGPRGTRITYDRGTVEIMSPSKKHEHLKTLLGRLIEAFTEEAEISILSTASTTLQREDLARAVEADESYYIRHEPDVRDREELDLSRDPPPDLAVEIDISRRSLDRRIIFAAMGIPEVWCFDGEQLGVYQLAPDGQYALAANSLALPDFPLEEATRLLRERSRLGETALVRSFRALVRERMGEE